MLKLILKFVGFLILITTSIIITVVIVNAYFVEIPIFLNEFNMPLLECKIENKKYILGLDFGAEESLLLRRDLDSIDKTFYRYSTNIDAFGNFNKAAVYRIPTIFLNEFQIDNHIFLEERENSNKNTTILWDERDEIDLSLETRSGRLGRSILRKTNVLLDVPNKKMVLSNSKWKLEWNGYRVNSWKKTPFIETMDGLIIKVETDFGLIKLILDTGCTVNFLKIGEFDEKEGPYKYDGILKKYKFDRLKIGSEEFLDFSYHHMIFPKVFSEIDGVLGMSFIKDVQIYIDYQNSVMYFNPIILDEKNVEF